MEGLCYRGVMLGVGVGAEEKLLFEATSITIESPWCKTNVAIVFVGN